MINVLLFITLLFPFYQINAPDNQRVQEFTGYIENDAVIFYDMFDLQAGDTLYIYAEATSGDLDTYITLADIDFIEVLAYNDDIGSSSTNSALKFPITETGDYSVSVTSYDETTSGDYRLLLGINAPDVMSGDAVSTGEPFAELYTGGIVATVEDCSQLQTRPELSGAELTRETENFVIHFTTSGRDGATPNFIDEVQSLVESLIEIQVNQMGWLPPPDCGEGGDARFDIYVVDTIYDAAVLGYAVPDAFIGDNPNTPETELYAAYSHLIIDNNFAGMPNPRPTMRATIAHEFHHAIQFGYDASEPDNWVYEATATWMETITFPNDQDATPYMIDLFQSADRCVGSTPEEENTSLRIYAEWALLDSITQDHGSEAMHTFWQQLLKYDSLDAYYSLLDLLQTTPQVVSQRFAIRNLLHDYELGDEFGAQVRVEANINGAGEVIPRLDGVQELGVDYLLVRTQGTYTMSINQKNLSLVVVGINQTRREASVFELGQSGTISTAGFTYTYVLVLNTDTHTSPYDCTTTDWVLTVTNGADQALTPASDELWQTIHFVPAG